MSHRVWSTSDERAVNCVEGQMFDKSERVVLEICVFSGVLKEDQSILAESRAEHQAQLKLSALQFLLVYIAGEQGRSIKALPLN